jgi:hypothetical protein
VGFALEAGVILTRWLRKAGWTVDVRPWPTGRRVHRETAKDKGEAIRRAETLIEEIRSGSRSF